MNLTTQPQAVSPVKKIFADSAEWSLANLKELDYQTEVARQVMAARITKYDTVEEFAFQLLLQDAFDNVVDGNIILLIQVIEGVLNQQTGYFLPVVGEVLNIPHPEDCLKCIVDLLELDFDDERLVEF